MVVKIVVVKRHALTPLLGHLDASWSSWGGNHLHHFRWKQEPGHRKSLHRDPEKCQVYLEQPKCPKPKKIPPWKNLGKTHGFSHGFSHGFRIRKPPFIEGMAPRMPSSIDGCTGDQDWWLRQRNDEVEGAFRCCLRSMIFHYPPVNIQKTMEHHHF